MIRLAQRAACLLVILTPLCVHGQATGRARPDLPTAARTIIASAQYATFITTDAAGHPQARTVQPLAPDSAWHVWFATNPRSRKVGQVRRDAHVALHYFDKPTESYVTIIGEARIVTDSATKNAHWDRTWDVFYKDRDSSVVLIDVRADQLEIVSAKMGITGDTATWRPPTVRVRTSAPPR